MNWFQTYNPVSAFISVTRAVLCILNFGTRCCVSLYQCCLGEAVCAEAKHVEGFLTLCINNSTLTGNKILLHGPSQWVWGHPRVVQKPTFSTAGVRALKRDVAEGLHSEKNGSSGLCCDWINHLWAGSEHTDRGEELQNTYAASAAAPDELF